MGGVALKKARVGRDANYRRFDFAAFGVCPPSQSTKGGDDTPLATCFSLPALASSLYARRFSACKERKEAGVDDDGTAPGSVCRQ
jgi:hypothetical protein